MLQELCAEKLLQLWIEPYFDFEIQRYATNALPDMSAFSGQELGFVDWWIKKVSETRTSALSPVGPHDYGWQIAKLGEELPLHAFLSRRIRPPREGDELDWAMQAANLRVTN